MNKCPCYNCICFPMCGQRVNLNCVLLYNFVCNTESNMFISFKPGAGTAVYEIYNKYILATDYSNYAVSLSSYDTRGVLGKSVLYD